MNSQKLRDLHDFILKIMYERDRAIVGKLLENIEIMVKENKFDPNLYKQLSKTIVWGEHRNFKKLLSAYFMPSITFQG